MMNVVADRLEGVTWYCRVEETNTKRDGDAHCEQVDWWCVCFCEYRRVGAASQLVAALFDAAPCDAYSAL